MTDTIFALATASGRAAVAVLRVSGPGAGGALESLAGTLPKPRNAALRTLKDPVSRETLDQALVLWMPGPASFTGEDVVELHLHGGRAVTAAVMDVLVELGLRPAEPGEFTRRAFECSRLDLTEAEAIADLVDAESEGQRRQALAQLGGRLSEQIERWRGDLITALASLEAAVDFPDEEVPEAVARRAEAPIRRVMTDLLAAAEDLRGERVREGYRVALIGAPNAGKSSLLNRVVGRNAAIVTEVAGTTRDVIEQPLELAGYRLLLADTAGLRDTNERIEAEGVRRARSWAEAADLRLWVVDGSGSNGDWNEALELIKQGDLLVLSKTDLASGADAAAARDAADAEELEPVETSVVDEDGIGELMAALERRVVRDLSGSGPITATRVRHRRLIAEAAAHLGRALGALGPELQAEDVRLAARSLETLVGKVGAEAVLGEIFSSFCIGK